MQKEKFKNSIQNSKIFLNFAFLILTFTFLLVGCGYRFQGKENLPFDSVKIGRIENKTFEPKLEDKLKKAIADELMKNGVMISNDSMHVINGVIETFELKALSEKGGLTAEYEVIIKGKFFLALPDGKSQELRGSGSFIVSFYNTGNLQSVMASKEQAIETALKNLSSEIRAGIIYR
jgi:outer membrane lipopolysaccharide assembly protein LptE/RlpB